MSQTGKGSKQGSTVLETRKGIAEDCSSWRILEHVLAKTEREKRSGYRASANARKTRAGDDGFFCVLDETSVLASDNKRA